jgi:serine/threonine-protein kinase
MTSCPSLTDLQNLLADRLIPARESALLTHVETCRTCQESLEELTAGCALSSPRRTSADGVRPPAESAPEEGFWRELKAAQPELPSTVPPTRATPAAQGGGGKTSEADRSVRLGRYEVREEIGRGGMGAVLHGHDPDLGRDLAVKVLLPDRQHDPAAVSRFLEEAQIGGQLQHPGIVPVYEVSRSAQQPPFFTMKLVQGRTLAALLSERSAPGQDLPRFLHIFEAVCQTLAYAHSRGVIHRDLKPANIMVGEFGEVQVMDWGLAKVMNREGGVSTRQGEGLHEEPTPVIRTTRSSGSGPVSQPGHVLGTPAYMPPEQALGETDRLDERCDVFGLGAILCEILTGLPPYPGVLDLQVLQKAARAELAEAFARLDGCGASPELIQLARDCLAAAAADRPRDAGVLAAALAGYRESMEFRLRRAELAQAEARARTQEERKRRRVLVALAGSVLLTLLVVVGGLFLNWRAREARAARAREALAQARAAWERARTGNDPAQWTEVRALARRAEALLEHDLADSELTEGVRHLFEALDEEQANRQMVYRLHEAILRGTGTRAESADNGPIVAAYAEAFRRYGVPVRELPLAEAAERLRGRSIRGDLAAALDHWAGLEGDPRQRTHLRELAIAVDDDPQRNEIRHALANNDLAALKRLSAPERAAGQPAGTVALLAEALVPQQALAEAEALLRRAREEHPEDFWVNHYLGAFYALRCRPPRSDEAIRFFTAAAAVRSDSPAAHLNLGWALASRGRREEAREAYEKALRLKPDYPEAHINLGSLFEKQGKLDAAVAAFQTAIRLEPRYASAHFSLGSARHAQGRLDEALAAYQQALAVLPTFARAQSNLGTVLQDKGDLPGAIAAYRRAIDLDAGLAPTWYNLGAGLVAQGDDTGALAAFRRAVAIDPGYALAHAGLGAILRRQGDLKGAVAAHRKVVALGPRHPRAHAGLGAVLKDYGDVAGAVAAYRQAIALAPRNAVFHGALGQALTLQGQFAEAIRATRRCLELLPPEDPWYHPITEQLRRCQGLLALDEKLPALLRGETQPANMSQRLGFAQVCLYKQLYAASARLHGESFADQPELADDLGSGRRYNAAWAAALAGQGQGHDTFHLDEKERARWRNQAQQWLRADLVLHARRLEKGTPADRTDVQNKMQRWLGDLHLAGVRDEAELARLPAEERQGWAKFWAEVEALRKKAQLVRMKGNG